MGGQHRLGALQVRVGRQHAVVIALGPPEPGPLQIQQLPVDLIDRLADPKPQVRGNLVVSAAGRVQFAANIAQAVDQCPLDVHVDIFQFDLEAELALPNLLAYVCQGLLNLVAFVMRDQAHGGQHAGVGDRSLDVVRVKPAIEADALGEILHPRICLMLENASPSLVSHTRLDRTRRDCSC